METNLIREHPIKSKINRWMERKLFEERLTYIHRHEWDAHQLSIEQCKALGNQQAAYFIQRDLTFRKEVTKSMTFLFDIQVFSLFIA